MATKTFQALRIFVNNELNELNVGMEVAHHFLKASGICVAITFHSLEDRIIKRHFHGIDMTEEKCLRIQQRARAARLNYDEQREAVDDILKHKWTPVKRKSITPSVSEIIQNPRCRSAKLRAAHKQIMS